MDHFMHMYIHQRIEIREQVEFKGDHVPSTNRWLGEIRASPGNIPTFKHKLFCFNCIPSPKWKIKYLQISLT